jgi:hypothetical protein
MTQATDDGLLLSGTPALTKRLLPMSVLVASLALASCGSDDDNNNNDNDNDVSVNTAPELVLTAGDTLLEDSVSAGAVLATITATDADGDTLSYSLSDNTYATISGDTVQLNSQGVNAVNDDSLNLSSLSVTVTVSDGELSATDSATVAITRIDDTVADNTAPELSATTNSLTEDSVSSTTVVATFDATDAEGDELFYRLDDNSDGYFMISGSTVVLTSAGVTAINDDSLSLTALSVTLVVSDNQLSAQQTLTINVTRVNDAPVLSVDAVSSLTEDDVTTDTQVATVEASDPEQDTLSVHIEGVNISYFTLTGNQITLSEAGVEAINDDDLNLTELSATVTVSDGVNSLEKTFTLAINRVDDAGETEEPREIKLFEDDFESASTAKWTVINSIAGSNSWITESYEGDLFAVANCYGSAGECDAWMMTPALDVTNFEDLQMTFNSAWNYGTGTDQMSLMVSTDYDGDVSTATWTDISDRATWSPGIFEFVESGTVDLSDFVGQPVYVAFHYAHPVSDASKWEIDDVLIKGNGTGDFPLAAEISVAGDEFYTERSIKFTGAAVNGAGEPYTYAWNFGDGASATDAVANHTFTEAGRYEVTLTVSDNDGDTETSSLFIDVATGSVYTVPEKSGDFRIATFNAGFDLQSAVGEQNTAFSGGEYRKAQKVAEIIQRANPDVLLLNEIDGNDDGATVNTFNEEYLQVAQADDVDAAVYPYVYYGDNGNTNYCNTGAPIEEGIEIDFNKDGDSLDPEDRYGFGNYNGQYCMAIFSKYPIDEANIRTFQEFKWADMPDYLVPSAVDSDGNVTDGNWYTDEEMTVFRLSSKTHIDLPVTIDGTTVHVLASHPTPPTFDGNEDRNGMRNFDEIRMWADYIDPASSYLYDDDGVSVTLAENTRFVILGDENASAKEGDAYTKDGVRAIEQLTLSELVNPNLHEDSTTFQAPTSVAGTENTPDSIYSSTHTASWAMRADYVLPSAFGLEVAQGGVFWPSSADNLNYLIEAIDSTDIASSDHRMVWMDLTLTDGTTAIGGGDTGTGNNGVELAADHFDSLDGFIVLDQGADSNNWYASSYGDLQYAKISCYNGAENCNDWLIKSVDLTTANTPVLTFDSLRNSYGPSDASEIALMISTDFDGTDTTTATWDDLSGQVNWATQPSSGYTDAISSGDIDLSAYEGQTVYIAIVYSSDPANSATWEIANFKVTGQLAPYAEDDFASLDDATVINGGADGNDWYASSYGDLQYAKISCYNGAENCNDWLIKSADLTSANVPVLTFDSLRNSYGPSDASEIALMISTDFDGSDTATATWDDLSHLVNWATQPSSGYTDAISSGEIDLSAYIGQTIYVAFVYTSDPANSATWEIANFLIQEKTSTVVDTDSSNTTGTTEIAETAPSYTALNAVNQRSEGTLSFEAVAAPVEGSADSYIAIGSTGLSVNGAAVANSGYKTLVKSGQLVDGNVYAQVRDSAGSDLFVSNYNEFMSILPIGDRIFAVSQFENIPGGMNLLELSQDSITGELTPMTTEVLDFSAIHGGYNHCAAVVTPWNTHLASEEYEPNARARSAATGSIDSYYDSIADYHTDLSLLQVNPYWYGYPVEVVVNAEGTDVRTDIVKHYSVARVSLEVPYVMPDRKTMYLTDDQSTGGGLFMYIADEAEDLSAGTLYAMKWNQTDSGSDDNAFMGAADIEWISLGHATNADISELVNGDNPLSFADIFDAVEPTGGACALGYKSINFLGSQECLSLKPGMEQAASRLETRRYAAYLDATVEFAKEEGFTYNPHNHKAYIAIANVSKGMLNGSSETGGPNHMQVTANQCGGIYELSMGSNAEIGSDFVIGAAKGEVAGTADGYACSVDGLSGPDNVAYVGYNTLIITEDTGLHANNFVWSYNLESKQVTRIFSAPNGAENTGPYMFNQINGFAYITNVVQHPGDISVDPSAGNEAEIGYFGPIPVAVDE